MSKHVHKRSAQWAKAMCRTANPPWDFDSSNKPIWDLLSQFTLSSKSILWRAWCSSYHSSQHMKSPLSDCRPVSKWINRLQVNFCTSKNVSWDKYVVVCNETRKCQWAALICHCIVILNYACADFWQVLHTLFLFPVRWFFVCMCAFLKDETEYPSW